MNEARDTEIIRLLFFLTEQGKIHWRSHYGNGRDYCTIGAYGISVARGGGMKDQTEIVIEEDSTSMLRIVSDSDAPQVEELRDKIRESVTERRIPGFLRALKSMAGEVQGP